MSRDLIELVDDEGAVLSAEYVLALIGLVGPMLGIGPYLNEQIYAYFYQIVGTLALPLACLIM